HLFEKLVENLYKTGVYQVNKSFFYTVNKNIMQTYTLWLYINRWMRNQNDANLLKKDATIIISSIFFLYFFFICQIFFSDDVYNYVVIRDFAERKTIFAPTIFFLFCCINIYFKNF